MSDDMAGDDPREIDDPVLAAIAGDLQAVVTELHGPVPGDVVSAAKAAWTWRTVDAELAELLEEETLAVRSGTSTAFAYAVAGVVIDVEVEGTTVLGQVGDASGEPVGATVVVEVAGTDGIRHVVEADIDEAGAFRAAVTPGRTRVAVSLPDGRRIVTPWLAT